MTDSFSVYSGPPSVYVIGVSTPVAAGFDAFFQERNVEWNRDVPYTTESISVFGGAVCYDSFHNPAKRTDNHYLQDQIVAHRHESVIEHIVLNFAVAHLPRSTQLELIRHRVGTAYSFRSQRFTDSWLEFVEPPLLRVQSDDVRTAYKELCHDTFTIYRDLAEALSADPLGEAVEGTLRRKRVKEAARAVLGNNVGSDGLVSINARELRHIIRMRTDLHAEAGIREFAYALYEAALPFIPSLLQDADVIDVEFGTPVVRFG